MVRNQSSGTRRRTGCTPKREFSPGVSASCSGRGKAARLESEDKELGTLGFRVCPLGIPESQSDCYSFPALMPERPRLDSPSQTAPDDLIQPFRIDPFALR